MATAAKPPPAPAKTEAESVDFIEKAVKDLDRARERAAGEVRDTIDDAAKRIRSAMKELRERVEHRADDFGTMFEDATEDARREMGRRAIMSQRSPEALTEMTTAVRKRRAQLAKKA